MITEWQDALMTGGGDVSLFPDGTGEDYEGMRSDLLVWRLPDPVPMGDQMIEIIVLDSWQNGYRVFPAYQDGSFWYAPRDDRLGGEDMASNQLCGGDNMSENGAVRLAERKISELFYND